MARKTTKAIKRRLIFTLPITLTIILVTSITSIVEVAKIKKYSNEEKKLTEELETLKKEADFLNTEIVKLNSPDYIARYAREKYLYTKNGEKVVIVDVITEEKKIENTNKEIDYLTYSLIGTGILLVLIIVGLIIKKSRK